MANVTITQLPTANALTGTEAIPLVQNGMTVQASAAQLGAFSVYNGTVTSVNATVPAFLTVSGGPITTSGTLAITYSGTALPIANGGTGSTSTQFVNLTSNVTDTLPVANGGTGLSSLTAGYIPYGNGTSAFASSAGLNYDTTTTTLTAPVLSVNSTTSTTPNLTFNASNSGITSGVAVSGSYLQTIIQNSSGTAGASTNYVLSNDLGTDSTYYGEFGMNSSVYSGASVPSDFFSINNGLYFSGHDGDISIGSGNGFKTYLAWGATGQSAHVINVSGAIGLNTNRAAGTGSGTTNFGTAGQPMLSGGSAATPTWGTLGTGGGGTGLTSFTANGVVYASSASVLATGTALTFDGANAFMSAGNFWQYAPAPTAPSGAVTLTAAQLATDIINTTGTTYTVTLPTATAIDTQYPSAGTSVGLNFHIVNTASGIITIAVNTGITSVGSLTVAVGVSAAFRLRRTATATYILYRIS